MKTVDPPIMELSSTEKLTRIWTEKDCVKEVVYKILSLIEPNYKTQVSACLHVLNDVEMKLNEVECEDLKFSMAREALLEVSKLLRNVNSKKVAISAFCDILVLYSCTETYFTTNEDYRRCTGGKVIVRNCDIKSEKSMDKWT